MKKNRPRRIIQGILFLFMMTLVMSFMAQLVNYFSTGADPAAIYNEEIKKSTSHSPAFQWINDKDQDQRALDEYQKKKIQTDYLQAWELVNFCYKNKLSFGLEDHFEDELVESLKAQIESNKSIRVVRLDKAHNIEFHFMSLDRRVISFTDHDVEIEKEIYASENDEVLAQTNERHTLKVIMELKDGRWKIKKFVEFKNQIS